MYLTIINDCHDPLTMTRQLVRAHTLFPHYALTPVAVGNYGDLEAAGIIIDVLDGAQGSPGIIFANVAPRHGKAKKWENGTPFGHLRVGKIDIYTTVDGATLSLLHKYGLAGSIEVYDLPEVIDSMIELGHFPASQREFIVNTQFRSYEFLPRVALWDQQGIALPKTVTPLSEFLKAPRAIWYIDNFGNCKTTLWKSDIGHEHGKKIKTKFGEITCYSRLKDVPNGEVGLTLGSSGYGDERFVELVVQGASAALKYELKVGDLLFDS